MLSGNTQPEVHDDNGFELPNIWLRQHRITVLDICDQLELSLSIAFDLLRSLVLEQIQEVRLLQKEKCLLFLAVHLNAL